MRKLFLLIPLLAFALLANADVIEISSATSNIIHTTIAASSTNDGDVIVLTDVGPYVNSKANSDDYTKLSKNITIQAANGITPVIQLEVPIQGRNGKSAKFIGIKFNCASLQYDNLVHFNDALDNELEFENCEFYNSSRYLVKLSSDKKVKSLKFKNCKFYDNSSNRGIIIDGTGIIDHLELDGCEVSGFAKEFIHGYAGTSHVGECIVNDCYFHNNSRSAVMFVASTVDGTQTCDDLTVTNSTFANIDATSEYESVIDIRPYGSTNTDAIKVIVDHCTFYNNETKNSDHANVRTCYLTDVTVSNCIFAHSADYARRATYCTGGGNINNCLTYHYTETGTKGHAYGATVNAASVVDDPLFNDLANNKYTYDGNWVTMSLSPARGAATDGSDLGDPRWYSDEVLPETNFATPYAFTGLKAVVSDKMEKDGDNYIHSKSSGGSAIWKVHATRACELAVTLNLLDSYDAGHRYTVEVFDADGNSIGSASEGAWSNSTGDKVLAQTIVLPSADDYKVVLTNDESGSTTTIKGVTLSYLGGAVQNLPCTMLPIDALRSARAYIDENDEFRFTNDDQADHVLDEWAKWNMHVTKAGYYKFATSVNSTNGHSYLVTVYNANETVEKGSKAQPGDNIWGAAKTFSTDLILLDEGDYIFKVQNTTKDSKGRIVNVVATYEGGAVVEIPANPIPLTDAVITAGATRNASGLSFNGSVSEYAQWNISAAAGVYNFTLTVTGSNYSIYKLDVLNGGDNIFTYSQGQTGTGTVTINNVFIPAAGNYVLQLANVNSSADGVITSISAALDDVLILDENATDATYLAAVNGEKKKILLNRTFKGGMYNTICLPFSDWVSSLELVFGTGYELLELESAVLEGDVLNLNFNTITGEFGHGRPYLIKPTHDVTNPMWTSSDGRTIDSSTGYNVKSSTNADFIGSFVAGTIPAGEDNLFLGPNNLLYFSDTTTPIKGTRAWFQVKGVPHPSQAIKHANIIANDQVVTSIDFTKGRNNKVMKAIENGQLIIIRNGERFTVQGQRIQ